MNKFSAQKFVQIGDTLCQLQQEIKIKKWSPVVRSVASRLCELMKSDLSAIGCQLSSEMAGSLANEVRDKSVSAEAIRAKSECLLLLITSEMKRHVFLWVPPDRAKWYEKKAESILGEEHASSRFSSALYDIEESAKCFALGCYTASVFHIMRATESGLTALARAVGYDTANTHQWGRFFEEFDKQSNAYLKDKKAARPPWDTHSAFLIQTSAELKAVANAWRHKVAHLDAKYTEDEARHFLEVIPVFLRQISQALDETGQWV